MDKILFFILIFCCINNGYSEVGTLTEEIKIEEKQTAKLTFLIGNVMVKKKGATTFEKAYLNMELGEGDEIKTSFRAKAEIHIDEDIVVIGGDTHIKIVIAKRVEKKKKTLLELFTGKLWIMIKRLIKAEAFNVQTPTAVAACRGTKFSIHVDLLQTWILVYEGEVYARGAVGPEVLIKPNEKVIIKVDEAPSPPMPLDEEDKREWEREFEREPSVTKPITPPEKREPSKPKRPLEFRGNLELANIEMEKESWMKIGFIPELNIGKLGIGFDMALYLDENNKLRKEDWDDWRDYLNKILYLSYGKREDRLYLRFGALKDVFLGNGFIVNNYTNMIDYPNIKRLGLEGRYRFSQKGIISGFEWLIADFAGEKRKKIIDYPIVIGHYENQPEKGTVTVKDYNNPIIKSYIDKVHLYGLRGYIHPLSKVTLPLLKDLQIGLTICRDFNPAPATETDNPVTVYGIDMKLPIKTNLLYVYGDIAKIDNYGIGFVLPGVASKIGPLHFNLEYRRIEANFIPSYFDNLYDSQREAKAIVKLPQLNKEKGEYRSGLYASLLFNLFDLLKTGINYEDYKGPGNGKLCSKILLTKELAQLSGFEITYIKNYVDFNKRMHFNKNSLLKISLDYKPSQLPFTTTIIYSCIYDEESKLTRTISFGSKFKF